MSAARYLIVMTTCPGEEEATRLARMLVEKKLAACVQASHITSTYRWQGAVETAPEVRLLIKAKAADYEAIAALVAALHSYENPEVLAIPVTAGAQLYLDWIEAETRGPAPG
jgi:periplasmic divalent cation tolerance protein